MITFAEKMYKTVIAPFISSVYEYYKDLYYIFTDGILTEKQIVEFVNISLEEYHGGNNEAYYTVCDWMLCCYHRYVGICHIPTQREKFVESLDAFFFYETINQYYDMDNLKFDIYCLIENLETVYCRLIGYEEME